jgi:transcriptional regulator with GAF, ATPase, and Fis domain
MFTKVLPSVEYYTESKYKEDLVKKIFCWKNFQYHIEPIAVALFFLTGTPKVFGYFSKVPSWLYALIIIFCMVFILYLLSKGISSNNEKIRLSQIHHKCTHRLRDIYVKSMNSLRTKSSSPTIVEETCNAICQEIEYIFNEIKKTNNVGVAIRLAKQENDDIYYVTRGRSGLNPEREKNSEKIPLSTGLPAFLNNRDQTGCLIYHDIFKAAAQNAFQLTKNENNAHKSEILSLMALPLNCGFSKTKKEMIGILYITSPQESFFSVHDVDFARNLADFSAIIITQILLEFKQLYQKK